DGYTNAYWPGTSYVDSQAPEDGIATAWQHVEVLSRPVITTVPAAYFVVGQSLQITGQVTSSDRVPDRHAAVPQQRRRPLRAGPDDGAPDAGRAPRRQRLHVQRLRAQQLHGAGRAALLRHRRQRRLPEHLLPTDGRLRRHQRRLPRHRPARAPLIATLMNRNPVSRRLLALVVAGALTASLTTSLTTVLHATPASAAAAPAPIGVPLTPENIAKAPHWTITAPTTSEAAVTMAGGALSLVTGTGGTSSGTAPAAAAAMSAPATGNTVDAPGEWPTGQHDRSRTGNAAWEEFITDPAGAVYTGTTLDKVQTNPAIVDDIAYFGGAGADKHIYELDLQTHNLIASGQLPGSVLSSPTVADGWVYFAAADGHVYRVSATDGHLSESWQFPQAASTAVGGFIGAPPRSTRASCTSVPPMATCTPSTPPTAPRSSRP